MIVFDTYAWLEYFSGSDKGKIVKGIIESNEEILTPAVCIAEIKKSFLKENKDYKSFLDFVVNRSKIIIIDLKIALVAASLSYQHKLHMIDALVYSSALSTNSELLTGDLHFKGIEKIRFLG